MARLVAEMTMSLDGFIALPDDSVNGVFDWYNNGPVEVPTARPDMTWHVAEASATLELEQTAVLQGDAVTHLYYQVLPRI